MLTQPKKFQTEKQKVLYAGSILRGDAFNWLEPYLHPKENGTVVPWQESFELFVAELVTHWGDPDEVATAERKLTNLRQTGSAAAYTAEFRRFAYIAKWDESALCHHYYHGLKDFIKDEICKIASRPDNLEELISFAIRCDNRAHERSLQISWEKGNTAHNNGNKQDKGKQPNSNSYWAKPAYVPGIPSYIPSQPPQSFVPAMSERVAGSIIDYNDGGV